MAAKSERGWMCAETTALRMSRSSKVSRRSCRSGPASEQMVAGTSHQPQANPHSKPKAPTKLIVVLPDESEDDWAKARIFDNPGQATALIETLVESGLAPEGMSVFSATRMVVDVAYRPVVKLTERRKRKKSPG